MRISRQNQKLLFSLVLIVALGLVVARVVEKGMAVVGEKERVLALADVFAQCTTREEYLTLLKKHVPRSVRLWESSAPGDTATTHSAHCERMPDGRLKVVAAMIQSQPLLDPGGLVYLPAALVDDSGHGYRLADLRLNSRKAGLIFEYYYAAVPEGRSSRARSFRFFMGPHQWTFHLDKAL